MIHIKRNLLIAAGLLMSTASWGQDAASPSFLDNYYQDVVFYLLIIVLVIFILSTIFIFHGFLNMMIDELPEEKQAKYRKANSGVNWEKLNKTLTDAVPISQEKDIMLDHEYDGIRELDNHLPPWWKWLFYATIVFAVAYMGYYYVLGIGMDQYEYYDMKMAKADEAKKAFLLTIADNVDETNVELVSDAGKLADGGKIFIMRCSACHGREGEGTVGPNLTDEYWIHGGDLVSIFKTVKYGIPNKMIAWEDQLLPSDIANVSSYVLSLQGTNPPNGKEAQGELYVAPEAPVDEEVDAVDNTGGDSGETDATAAAE